MTRDPRTGKEELKNNFNFKFKGDINKIKKIKPITYLDGMHYLSARRKFLVEF
jgi:hypothetical protein